MKNKIKGLWKVPEIKAYLIANLVLNLSTGWFFGIYTIFLTQKAGLNLAQANLVNTVYMALSTLFDPYTGKLADKFGQKKVYVWGQIWWALGMLAYGFADNFWHCILAESLAAIGHALMSQALETWLRNRLGEEKAHKAVSMDGVTRLASIPTALTGSFIASEYGLEWPWRIAGVMGLVGAVVVYKVIHKLPDEGNGQREPSIKEAFSLITRNFALRKYLAIIFSYSALVQPLNMFWAVILAEKAGSFSWLGGLWIPISFLFAFGSQKASKYKSLKLAILITAVPIMLASASNNLWIIMLGFLIHEVGRGMISPVFFTLTNRHIPNHIRSTASSTITAGRTAGSVVGLLVSGLLTLYLKPLEVWLIVGIGLAILGIVVKTDTDK